MSQGRFAGAGATVAGFAAAGFAAPGASGAWYGSPVGAGGGSTTGGTITLTGAGTDIWNNSDQFTFAYKTLNGDGSMTARVVSIGPGSNGAGILDSPTVRYFRMNA